MLVNGLGDHGEPRVDDTPAAVRFFTEQFPKADVEFFDLFHEQAASPDDCYIREVAKDVIQRLQRAANARPVVIITPCGPLSSPDVLFANAGVKGR